MIEWTGANDLLTVNIEPTNEIAQKSIHARVFNVEELIKAGYHHFVLLNLPDLSLTPRFCVKTREEREKIRNVTSYFNALLTEQVNLLKEKYPQCSIHIFDMGVVVDDIFKRPESFGFDPEKLNQPYIHSPQYN